MPALGEFAESQTPLALRPLRRRPFTQESWRGVEEAARRLGIAELRTEQRKAVRAALEGRDVLFAPAAGSGKTTVSEIAAQLLEQPTLVISTAGALQVEQESRLLQRRVPVVRFHAELRGAEREQALARLRNGGALLCLISPHELAQQDFQRALSECGVALVVAEEAQQLSAWSYDYHPAAPMLAPLLRRLGKPPVLALCAPSPAAVRHELCDRLLMIDPVVIEGAAVRENIALSALVARGEVRQRKLVSLVAKLRRPGIVFCNTPEDVDRVAAALTALRHPVHRFHGKMSAGERGGELLNFLLPGRRAIMVAESAFSATLGGRAGFGFGFEKRDIRFVIHYQAPLSLEQYVREVACAGRDGAAADAILLLDPADKTTGDARLTELRPRPRLLAQLGRAFERVALERRAVALEGLALSTGLSRRATEELTRLLCDAGLAVEACGWARAALPAPALNEAMRRLVQELERQIVHDSRRSEAIVSYSSGSECLVGWLGRYFAAGSLSSCSPVKSKHAPPCSVCSTSSSQLLGQSEEPPPARRSAVREFSTSAERAGALTAKLGDFFAA